MHFPDFTARMDAGRIAAMTRRNRGLPTGKSAPGWNRKRTHAEAGSWDALVEQARREWRSTCRQAQNDFRVACLNGPHDDPSTWEI